MSKDQTHDVAGIHDGCHLFNKTLRVHWFGFQDSESEITEFRLGLGSSPSLVDIRPLINVGLVTHSTINLSDIIDISPGQVIYATVEAVNGAGLVTKSSSPPTKLVVDDEELFAEEGHFFCLSV